MGKLVLLVQEKDNAICVICRKTITFFKSFNLKRHHEQKPEEIVKLCVSERKAKLQLLKTDLSSQQNVYRRSSSEANTIVNARLLITQIIAKKMKSFSDGKYIKEGVLAAAEKNAPKKVNNFSQISLSDRIVSRTVELILHQMTSVKRLQLIQHLSSIFPWLLMRRRILLTHRH